jgi:hypothetical protein
VENWLGPFLSGLIESMAASLTIALVFWGGLESLTVAAPSAQVFRDLSQVGAAFFVAFAVATAGAAAFAGGNLKEHVNWLGYVCGIGVSGFLAIASSIALAAYRDAGHTGWPSTLGLCWVGTGIGLLGILVAGLPYAAFRWSRRSGR